MCLKTIYAHVLWSLVLRVPVNWIPIQPDLFGHCRPVININLIHIILTNPFFHHDLFIKRTATAKVRLHRSGTIQRAAVTPG